MKEMTLSFRMRGSGAVPPASSAILVPMMLLPRSMRGPKRSVIVWKRPVAPSQRWGWRRQCRRRPASCPAASQVVLQHALAAAAPSTLCTQAVQPVQCSMCRFCSWMNSTSAPISLAPSGLDAHTVVAAVAHTAGNTQNFHLYFLLLKSKKFSLPSFPLHITRSLPLCKMPVLYG
mgnify:CR=1 FL=1